MFWLVATFFALLFYAALLQSYHGHFKKLPLFLPAADKPQTFVSVLIAARNEEKNLPQLLHALAAQSYPQALFEIIVVDDFSEDGTAAVVQTFSRVHARVVRPNVAAEVSSKKRALEAGIAAARGALLLITDADCVPGPKWVETVACFYQQTGAVFIAAPVRFTSNGSVLQTFQAIDFLTLQGITAAGVSSGTHSLCNGANLAYTKTVFGAVNGFTGIDNVASGDDLLLMQKIKRHAPGKVCYLKSLDAVVTTAPMQSWRAFVAQRRRWASKTRYYDDKKTVWVLAGIYCFNLLFFVLLLAGFWQPVAWLAAFIFWVVKTAVEWPFVKLVSQFFRQRFTLAAFCCLQPLHLFYTVAVGFLSQLGAYEWKGRRTR